MKMSMRWYGTGFDTVTLSQIRQVPGVTGVITTLYDALPGEVWSRERIQKMIAGVEAAGLCVHGIESVNVHDSIKAGSADRDRYIDAYIQTIQNLGESGVHLVCYNFMPVFDWTRSDLAKPRPDGSTVLAYDQSIVDQIDPDRMLKSISEKSNGAVLPGWEPERLSRLRELFQLYADVSEEKLFENLVVENRPRRAAHLLNEEFRRHPVPLGIGFVDRAHFGLGQALLQRANHDQIRDVQPVIPLFPRLRHHLRAHIIVDRRRGDQLILLQLRRQIVQILLQQRHHLLHIQPDIRDFLPRGQPEALQIFLPAPQLARDQPLIVPHRCSSLKCKAV